MSLPCASPTYDSPMHPPSPLPRQRPLFPLNLNVLDDQFKSPAPPAHAFNPFYASTSSIDSKPQPIDDEEGAIFLSSGTSGSLPPFFTASNSQPLLTPVKKIHQVASRAAFAASSNPVFSEVASVDHHQQGRANTVGQKRKSLPQTTPLRHNTLTPLKITNHSKRSDNAVAFECLAPLPAPKFNLRTPQSKAETDAYLKRQTATLTRLRLTDPAAAAANDETEFDGAATDSGCEMDEDDPSDSLFLSNARRKPASAQLPKTLNFHSPVSKGKEKAVEVVEAVSPGGHINKRRARSRPVSSELREHTFKVPKSPIRPSAIPSRVGFNRPRHSGPLVFPSNGRSSPASSSSENGSPRPKPKRRISGDPSFARPQPVQPNRPPLSRIDSVSAASLFFGPAIPAKQQKLPTARYRTNSTHPTSTAQSLSASLGSRPTPRPPPSPSRVGGSSRPILANRHSYAGPESSVRSADRHLWNAFQTRNVSPSPGSSPFGHPDGDEDDDMDLSDEEMFFAGEEPAANPFMLNVTRNSPSPPPKPPAPIKYKLADTSMNSDEDDSMPSTGSSVGTHDFLNVMPKASTSVSSICSEDGGLVTPGVTPDVSSGWPKARVFGADDTTHHHHHPYGNTNEETTDEVDAFIVKTLAAASNGQACQMPKKIPGTPVKKVRMSYFGNERPWQSAVASKVGLKEDCEFEFRNAPRKSMPAAFPAPLASGSGWGQGPGDFRASQTDTEEDEEDSPSVRRDNKYTGLGLGMPPPPIGRGLPALPRNRWLMRRSSSGAFSSGSETASLSNTPTRAKGIDWQLPKPRIPPHLSPSSENKGFPRSASGSSSGSFTALNSPTNGKKATTTSAGAGRPSIATTRRLSEPVFSFSEEPQTGRFDREFEEIEEVGSGEFGRVIKVRSKKDDAVYAIKKSKRFEGPKHRLRLREEVDILKHLSQAALSQYENGRHPNVLAYMDSWEEDEALFMQTELCESGNLARFLWEYGRVYPRLDEARVWKIIVDLSNGLRFIHESGVIHLDLKPSNVFVTKEGRFKIGDFGMASVWPLAANSEGFEREGDKLYLAPEVLQGRYGKAADVFSLGMTILETATNIVVPDQGDGWQRLRREDFSQIDLEEESAELVELILNMMRTDPERRISIEGICEHEVVRRARAEMEEIESRLGVWAASPLASVQAGFLDRILHSSD
ncbi:hypothetical protein CPC08DRAFT_683679 [Agrocybe pediades]|nr:hypothetical protein CPC08DRAFT_683679 [Agrocybe pediades]